MRSLGVNSAVPALRVRQAGSGRLQAAGRYVLYWMIAARRTEYNFGLQRAAEWARALGKPLLVFEPLRAGYPWASDRLHRFVLAGMRDQAEEIGQSTASYFPYVEPRPGAGSGLLEALAAAACLVVTDEFPCFFLPRMVAAVAQRLTVPVEVVDANGLVPLRAAEQAYPTAYAFRRFLQRNLLPHLAAAPLERPLRRLALPRLGPLPRAILARWPAASAALLAGERTALDELPIDHGIGPGLAAGGARAGALAVERLLAERLPQYEAERNVPDREGSSGLSPYLHFGHVSAYQVWARIAAAEEWTPERVSARATGSRAGWWGLSQAAEAFLDQLVTWRELGYNFCTHRADYDRYESLPEWAQATLARHALDRRDPCYELPLFERAETHDPLWNAAQRQLVREGRLHNYLRMLWGKKILQWSATPREALATMIELNNKYALDGRNPNSYSGIFWTLGRFDRPWGPERPVFGTVRYMTSENTARKVAVREFLQRYAP